MKLHWKVLSWMLAGAIVGLALQQVEGPAWTGAAWSAGDGGLVLESARGPAEKASMAPGDRFVAIILDRGQEGQSRLELSAAADMQAALDASSNGDVLWLERHEGDPEPTALAVVLDPASARVRWISPFAFVADIFLALLKMLIVPLVMSSIISGVAGVGSMSDLKRLGAKTFGYYVATSLAAIAVGQLLVNLIKPGVGAGLGLSPLAAREAAPEASFWGVLKRMVPENVPGAMTQNGAMLQIIFFALLFGFFINRAAAPHGQRMREFVSSFFEIMMRMAEGVLSLLPYGVFALMVKVVAGTGFGIFKPLMLYMVTVTLALLIHAAVTLPLVLKLVGGLSPRRWFKAMSPVLMTAFSTSSSSMTLPVTMENVEHRGKVSHKVTSFTLPLGATINMDGTALYECIGVIFLAQYYASQPGGVALTFAAQAMVVLLALLASIGAAGIPSAGLVMMLTILAALDLPLEGAALLLAVDRPLDMLRTVVNVWSDSCGAAVIARSEGEEGPLTAGT